jgi:hypothetical protein
MRETGQDPNRDHANTRRALGAWSAVEDPDSPARVARVALDSRSHGNVERARPWLVGLAAALIAFAGLAFSGAELTRDGGRVTLSLRLPFGGTQAPPRSDQGLEQRAAAAARHATEQALASFEQTQAAQGIEREQRRRMERVELVRAIDRALAAERRRTAGWIGLYSRGAAREDHRTREAVAQLVSHLSDQPR